MSDSARGHALARWFPFLYFILACCAVGLYLGISYAQNGGFGFPLDDAWIHQVYARNLGTRFEFSFFPGQPSAGSTSPLWAILLAVGYAVGLDFRVWAILLGVTFLGASGWMAARVMRYLIDDARLVRWAAPLFVLLEWHMVWAAASGMEILLFVFLSLALTEAFFARRNPLYMGALAGLLVLTRPDGVLWVGLVGLGLVFRVLGAERPSRSPETSKVLSLSPLETSTGTATSAQEHLGGWAGVLVFAAVCGIVLLPYVWFNLQTSGTILPNTFYAKATEYAALTQQGNLLTRWLLLYRQPLSGAQLLLVPGLVFGLFLLARGQEWERLLPALVILVLPLLYAWRLPVEYQFGRYMMPIIPFVILYGIMGTAWLLAKIPMRLLRRVWVITTAALVPAFLLIGANAYARSVGIVNCEMVVTARWAHANVPPGALVAVHDIGAQGYFDNHPMLDLAGLVSPEVIPIMTDEGKLREWMRAKGAEYMILFPSWYPQLTALGEATQLFSTGCALSREMGEANLGVYQLR